MKKQALIIIIGILVMFTIFYLYNREPEIEHPTLTAEAQMPDFYLKKVDHYEEKARHELSAYSLEKAIESIWKLEKDVDETSFQKLEEAINRLADIHHGILEDSVDVHSMRSTFEYTLNNLAHAELEIAEMYAETNQMDKANIAVKYARLHIKNAMLLHDTFWNENSRQLAIEKQVFQEMDSLIDNKSVSPVSYAVTLDNMIKEVDEILKQQQ